MEARKRRTVYEHKGYKLRSYTELMWARLMDAVDIFYLYEPHLLQIEGGFYLPDFYLPSSDIYLEVKGEQPTAEEYRKAAEATQATGRPVVFLIARPQSDKGGFMNCYLDMPTASGRGPFSLHDLDQLYLEVAGSTAWTKALLSVREDDMDWVRSLGEAMDEVLMQLSGRSGMESHLRLIHKRVNEARLQEARSESIAEQGIAWWRNRYHPKPDQSQSPVHTPSARGAQ